MVRSKNDEISARKTIPAGGVGSEEEEERRARRTRGGGGKKKSENMVIDHIVYISTSYNKWSEAPLIETGSNLLTTYDGGKIMLTHQNKTKNCMGSSKWWISYKC